MSAIYSEAAPVGRRSGNPTIISRVAKLAGEFMTTGEIVAAMPDVPKDTIYQYMKRLREEGAVCIPAIWARRKIAQADVIEARIAERQAALRAEAATHAAALLDGLRIGGPVATRGACTPARGTLLAVEGEFAWVLFDGADQPKTWPLKYLEVLK